MPHAAKPKTFNNGYATRLLGNQEISLFAVVSRKRESKIKSPTAKTVKGL